MTHSYKPEGTDTRERFRGNALSLSDAENCMNEKRVLEGLAIRCDEQMDLWVDCGGILGRIPKEEVYYLFPGEARKDIAVISRVGKKVAFCITDIGRGPDGKPYLTLSRRLAQTACLENYVNKLKPGDIIDAKVTHMEQFGAFCDIGCGIVALLSVDCISVSRISHPRDRFDIGDNIRVIVKSRTEEGRVYVTHRELLGTWEENAVLFSAGQTVAGIVRSVESYGIFVELTPNLAGLAEPCRDVVPSSTYAVYIKSILPERMKIKLVLVGSKGDPPIRLPLRYPGDLYLREHIDAWRYSPAECGRVIETVFE